MFELFDFKLPFIVGASLGDAVILNVNKQGLVFGKRAKPFEEFDGWVTGIRNDKDNRACFFMRTGVFPMGHDSTYHPINKQGFYLPPVPRGSAVFWDTEKMEFTLNGGAGCVLAGAVTESRYYFGAGIDAGEKLKPSRVYESKTSNTEDPFERVDVDMPTSDVDGHPLNQADRVIIANLKGTKTELRLMFHGEAVSRLAWNGEYDVIRLYQFNPEVDSWVSVANPEYPLVVTHFLVDVGLYRDHLARYTPDAKK